MLSAKLVRMIEDHAEELTRTTLEELASNPRTSRYHQLTREELHRRVYEVYRNLGKWLLDKTEEQIEETYTDLGRRRYKEGVDLSQVIYAFIIEKYHLRAYVRHAGFVDSAVELYQEQELQRMVGHFFDKATYYTTLGYEGAAAGAKAHAGSLKA